MLLMRGKTTKLRQSRYTILEMMAVIVLTALLLNGALFFYYNGRKLSMQYSDKALAIKSIDAVKVYFRDFASRHGRAFMVKPEEIMFDKETSIFQEKNRLVFKSGQSRKIISLPKRFRVTFARETPKNEAALLVINLIPQGRKDQLLQDKATRIVAIEAEEEKSK